MKMSNQTVLSSLKKAADAAILNFIEEQPIDIGARHTEESLLFSGMQTIPWVLIEKKCARNNRTSFNISLNGVSDRLDCSYPYELFCVLCNEI